MPGSSLRLLGAVVALLAAAGFSVGAGRLALHGTGAQLPSGPEVIEGTVAPGETLPAPVGEPFLYGRIALTVPEKNEQPGRYGRVFHSETFGSPEVVLETADGTRRVTLPDPERWQEARTDYRALASLDGAPLVSDAPEWRDVREQTGRVGVGLVAVRPGDAVVIGPDALYFGSREELAAAYEQREAMRWPIVGLLAVMAAVSAALGFAALRRRRAPAA